MKYFKSKFSDIQNIDSNKKSIITIGNFDGFHIYHQKIINQVINLAKANNLNSIVISFDTKIKDFLENKNTNISNEEQKLEYIKNNLKDLDYFYNVQVDEELVKCSKQDFVEMLKSKLNVTKIIEGEDFKFGFNAQGDNQYLIEIFGKENIIIEPRNNEISSTNIKNMINQNKIKKAQELLGIKLQK